MKKELKKVTSTALLKFVATLMLIASTILVHLEYIMDVTKPSIPEPHVMRVHIETGDNAKAEEEAREKTTDLTIQDNEISAIISGDFKIQASAQEKLEQYRMYLSNVVHLSKKLLQHEDYDQEVEFLFKTKDDYPNDVVRLLKDLKDYRDKYLTSKDEEYTKLDLDGSFANRILNKIVNIEKKNPQYEIREAEYIKLKSQLDGIIVYFYSKEFLKKYVGND